MDFKTLAEILFTGKSIVTDKTTGYKTTYTYVEVTDQQKEELFFIINRFLSKKYPAQAQYFNQYAQDKATAMDIWNLTIKKSYRIPGWFWAGSRKIKEPKIKDWQLFYKDNDNELDMNDVFILEELYPEELKDCIKYIKEIEKEKNK